MVIPMLILHVYMDMSVLNEPPGSQALGSVTQSVTEANSYLQQQAALATGSDCWD